MWFWGCETFCDSNLKGIEPSLHNPSWQKYFTSPWWSAATPWTPNLKSFRIPHHRVFSGRREGSVDFLPTGCYGPMHILGLYSTLSLQSTPDPSHYSPRQKKIAWFPGLDTHSAHAKITFLQCSQVLYILRQNIHPYHGSVCEMGKFWLTHG